MKEKNFFLYSQSRKGLLPRALILNNGNWIIDKLIQKHNGMITIVEIGFNHGNDSRYICEQMYKNLGASNWNFFGYDYEKYFMPQNLLMDENLYFGINKCIHSIPCTLVALSEEKCKLPPKIDFLYSSKTLTLCEMDIFIKLMTVLCKRISDEGFFVCSLHTKTTLDDPFPTYNELLNMISYNDIFSEFELYIQSNNSMCNFAFIAQKTKRHTILVCDEMFINDCQQDYEKKAKEETDKIFI